MRAGDHRRFDRFGERIEDIGFRSTRIRAPDPTAIPIPNATFVNMSLVNKSLVNLGDRDRRSHARSVRLRRTAEAASIREEMEAYAAPVAGRRRIEPGSVEALGRRIGGGPRRSGSGVGGCACREDGLIGAVRPGEHGTRRAGAQRVWEAPLPSCGRPVPGEGSGFVSETCLWSQRERRPSGSRQSGWP